MKAKIFMAVAVACLLVTSTASASVLLVPLTYEDSVPNSGNNFNSALTGLGFDSILSGSILATTAGSVEFFYHGSESGWDNQFLATGGVSGSVDFTETGNYGWDAAGVSLGTIFVAAGEAIDMSFDSNNGPLHGIGTAEFGIFADLAGMTFFGTDGRAYFGHDDNGAGVDDNHDDIVISARFSQGGGHITPEPGSVLIWGALGLVGMVSTRRRNR